MTRTEPPLLELRHVSRVHRAGATEIRALDDVTLRIDAGEFVAIMGPSGSGKTTLMNLVGCLDRLTSGTYRVRGRDVAELDPDALASLRRETFGFVFQRYNLLPTATALENVEIPAIYAGVDAWQRRERAVALLERLGLGDRMQHRPTELSGGQQQRVSIARALMNGPEVILADEPTGALDSRTSAELLGVLADLNAEGHTVVLITHDPEVARRASRQIHLHDGGVREDRASDTRRARPHLRPDPGAGRDAHPRAPVLESVRMALRSLRVHVFRTALTLLGVVIGVASVVTMLAIGEGSQREVLERIESMGSDLLFVRPGAPGMRGRGSDIATLTREDVAAVAEVDNVLHAVPERRDRATVRFRDVDTQTEVQGVSEEFPLARSWPVHQGGFFTREDVERYAPVVVLGSSVAEELFGPERSPIGELVVLGGSPFEVVGVLESRGASTFGSDMDDVALVPITSGFLRLFGQQFLSGLLVRVADPGAIDATERRIRTLLMTRHGSEDFRIFNTAALLETVQDTQATFTLLLGSVAAISLLVGGIGVMNIMLVSVTERTREIGVRMATGARRSDILVQFNTEALVVCGLGGLIGVVTGLAAALGLDRAGMSIALSPGPAGLAFSSALVTGLVFGYLPARTAARLDPVVALASE